MTLSDALRPWRARLTAAPWRVASALNLWQGEGSQVQFVVEKADWAIRWVGEHVRNEANEIRPGTVGVTDEPWRLARRVVHFGSQYMWLMWRDHLPRSNRYVTSFFHGKPEDGPEVARHIDQFMRSVPALDRIVTGAGLVERRLLDWGVPRDKLVRIPIGTDTKIFRPPSLEERRAARAAFGLDDETLVVGSFQKDGQGWGDGMDPKPIKGPDTLIDALTELARHRKVTAFLTGPARGFVKHGLERVGIPYVHRYVKEQTDLVTFYHALDLYLVTSREEGGPMGLMESMASGVPVVSTAVGMAPDLIQPGQTGGLVEEQVGRVLAHAALALLEQADLEALRIAARQAVGVTDWSVVGRRHLEEVYQPLLMDRP